MLLVAYPTQPGPILFGEDFINGQSVEGIYLQQGFYEFFAFLGDIGVNVLELALFDLLEQVYLIFGSEGVITLQHDIVQNPQRPHIRIDWTVILFRDYLRCHICRSTTESINSLILETPQAKAKVNEL